MIWSPWGGSDVAGNNCYIDLGLANSYILNVKQDISVWTNASTHIQEAALFAATRDIDNACNWSGDKTFVDQALNFPRVPSGEEPWPWIQRTLSGGVIGISTYSIYLTNQKKNVQQACAEQAYKLVRDGERNEHLDRIMSGLRSYSESVGPISESGSYGGPPINLCSEAVRLLLPYRGTPSIQRA